MKLEICMPGKSFSDVWVVSYTKLLGALTDRKIEYNLNFGYGSDVARNRDVMAAKKHKSRKPFGGIPYDYILWIDSDQVFRWEHFKMLLDADKDIISAAIKTTTFDYACGWWENGDITRVKTLDAFHHPFEVSYTGFGFTLIRRGVYEAVGYPWHRHTILENGEYLGEDISFMLRARDKGYKIFVHPKCRVGHLKELEI